MADSVRELFLHQHLTSEAQAHDYSRVPDCHHPLTTTEVIASPIHLHQAEIHR